jgi:hypothetical protein
MIYFLLWSKVYDSSENVEKVVNPPHTPVFQNKTSCGLTFFLLSVIPLINPIRKAPRIFVTKVSAGNSVLTGSKLTAYLPMAPAAPPRATKMKFNGKIIISLLYNLNGVCLMMAGYPALPSDSRLQHQRRMILSRSGIQHFRPLHLIFYPVTDQKIINSPSGIIYFRSLDPLSPPGID